MRGSIEQNTSSQAEDQREQVRWMERARRYELLDSPPWHKTPNNRLEDDVLHDIQNTPHIRRHYSEIESDSHLFDSSAAPHKRRRTGSPDSIIVTEPIENADMFWCSPVHPGDEDPIARLRTTVDDAFSDDGSGNEGDSRDPSPSDTVMHDLQVAHSSRPLQTARAAAKSSSERPGIPSTRFTFSVARPVTDSLHDALACLTFNDERAQQPSGPLSVWVVSASPAVSVIDTMITPAVRSPYNLRNHISIATNNPPAHASVQSRTVTNRRSQGQLRRWADIRARREKAPATSSSQPAQLQAIIHNHEQVRGLAQDLPSSPISTPPAARRRRNAQQQSIARDRTSVRNDPSLPLYWRARTPYNEPESHHSLGPMSVICPDCGALHWSKERTTASRRGRPVFGICCDHGSVQLPLLNQPPLELQNLLDDVASPTAVEFRNHIRQYNCALAFTSLYANIDNRVSNNHSGPYVFRIHGQLCHNISPLQPQNGDIPSYCQLYIYDGQEALNIRMNRNTELSTTTMATLQGMLLRTHRFAGTFHSAHEVLRNTPMQDVALTLHCLSSNDRRRYNLPSTDEVAVIIPTLNNRNWDMDSRDIVLHHRGVGLTHISEGHPAYAGLHYVLLFPYGEDGWHWNLHLRPLSDHAPPKRLTLTWWTAFRLFDRDGEFSTVLRGGRLLQEFMVDMWVQADQERLRWARLNQTQICSDLYSGLADAVGAGGDQVDLQRVGHKIILLSLYAGGARYMHQIYQDSMCISSHSGKVDLFITMTCNPRWPEILQALHPGQQPEDRPDLLTRVFKLKKQALLDDIMKNGIFGRSVAHVYTIEFQKQGLPHMHLLVWLWDVDKLRRPEDVDTCIHAFWPDPDAEPLLFQTVQTCMIHGPCGTLNPNTACMDGGHCTKGYPKEFQPFTTMDNNGYLTYYRPDDGRRYNVKSVWIDNWWIVPYCPYLSAKYHCHINVECAFSVGSVKYIHKYIFKGHDRATIELQGQDDDEIQHFLDGRYIGPSEAAWRTFHFVLHEEHPNVVRLQVHLPGQHLVLFDPDKSLQAVLQCAAAEQTTLTVFFMANKDTTELGGHLTILHWLSAADICVFHQGHIAHQYTYAEFPSCFVWNVKQKCWTL